MIVAINISLRNKDIILTGKRHDMLLRFIAMTVAVSMVVIVIVTVGMIVVVFVIVVVSMIVTAGVSRVFIRMQHPHNIQITP